MAVRSLRMLFSSSQLGSGLLGKSRYATQMVLRPSHAMGSITFFTISSLSRGRKTLGSPTSLRIWLHLKWRITGYCANMMIKLDANKPTRWRFVLPLFILSIWLTFWGQSQMLLCCTCESSHQATWWQCSWIFWQSWRCRLCKASPLGSGSLLAGNPALGLWPIPAGHTLSCCPPASADRLPYLEAEEKGKTLSVHACIYLLIYLFYFILVFLIKGHVSRSWMRFRNKWSLLSEQWTVSERGLNKYIRLC